MNSSAPVFSLVQTVGAAPSLEKIVMERSRSYFLTLISVVSVLLAIYSWSDKSQTAKSLELAMNELRELTNRFEPAELSESKTDDYRSILEDIGSGDMKQFCIVLTSVLKIKYKIPSSRLNTRYQVQDIFYSRACSKNHHVAELRNN